MNNQKNEYLKRRAEEQRELANTIERVVRQLMIDTLQVTLHDSGLGYTRVKQVSEAWAAKYEKYRNGLSMYNRRKKSDERDVYQEHLDRELRDLVKNNQEFIPFKDRYPELKEILY